MSDRDFKSRDCYTYNSHFLTFHHSSIPITTFLVRACLYGSIITDFPPGLWFHMNCSNSTLQDFPLHDKSEVVIESRPIVNNSMYSLSSDGDTLNLIFIGLGPELTFYTSVEEVDQSLEIDVFPNPTSEKINISITDDIIKEVELYTITGQQLKEYIIGSNEMNLDMSSYQDGIYLIKVEISSGAYVWKKILVQR